ncbi:hypothetical protein GJ744_009578 [Endocarpon pusillum]|uniref:Uncharacterized protein n=1 Tax=Endocarpon pusillum TaxID=364733 RepID=A0A8H7E3M5_9EURO|nr:hypothetical protein GJ744_009578 [Endocarpon pusillum]
MEGVVEGMGGEPGDMGLERWEEGMTKEQKLRVAFVVVLERALGVSLEGNAGEVRKSGDGIVILLHREMWKTLSLSVC